MKNFIYLLLMLLSSASGLNAQTNFGKEWVIGTFGYKIKFDNPIVHDTIFYTNNIGFFSEGHTNICDANGNMILSSDGMDIINSAGNLIEDGDSLATDSFFNFSGTYSGYSQTTLFLPMANKKYYLVTPTCNDSMLNNQWLTFTYGGFNILNYHIIDMNANGGAGKVIKRMQPLLQNRYMDKTQMMACQHANGKDWWLFKKSGIVGGDSNFFYTFLFTQDSVHNTGLQHLPFARNDLFKGDNYGQMQFNQSGTQLATIVDNNLQILYIADFDRCGGQLSNHKKISVPPVAGDSTTAGLAYSPNGRFLYIVKYSCILQFDLLDPNPVTAWYVVYGMDTTPSQFNGYTCAQLAQNGKIYFGHFHGLSKQMSVIDNPNIKGAGCNFCRKCLRAQSNWCYIQAPPDMPNYELGPDTTKPCWPLGAGDIEKATTEINIYPNPFSNSISIEGNFLLGKENEIQLYDLLGRVVLKKKGVSKNGIINLSVGNLNSGMYLLKVNDVLRKVMKD